MNLIVLAVFALICVAAWLVINQWSWDRFVSHNFSESLDNG